MTQHGIGDEATLKKIIYEVDTDNVLKFLMERNSVNVLHGQVTSGTLILQDCAVSLLFALLPVLGGTSGVLQGVTYMTKSVDLHRYVASHAVISQGLSLHNPLHMFAVQPYSPVTKQQLGFEFGFELGHEQQVLTTLLPWISVTTIDVILAIWRAYSSILHEHYFFETQSKNVMKWRNRNAKTYDFAS
ncbi:hypothetical protein HN51_022372 [Arachis hypogaea]